ncbi:MAG: LAGLIDADG family homing endonuclease [Candidatus Aenigmatarchaeota archaeon]
MTVKRIMKRDGKITTFAVEKISEAIYKAAEQVGGKDKKTADELAIKVMSILEKRSADQRNYIPTVEEVQDLVEKVLMEEGHTKTAKTYILYRQERSRIRNDARIILGGKFTKMYKKLSLNALKIMAARYLVQDLDGNVVESPEEMFERVARSLAEIEKDYGKTDEQIKKFQKEFSSALMSLEFLPGGRTLTNAGGPTRLVSNCIVLHPDDSMEGIFETLKNAALLQQAGSGLGFPWHLLRPAATRTIRSRGVASGPVSFLRIYDKAFGTIKQQGRHGANMAVMSVTHPDILEFIHCKEREGEMKNFNISVSLTDNFMQRVMTNDPSPWICEWRGMDMKPRRIMRDRYDTIEKITEETISARELMDEIVNASWNNGEPGIMFSDNINRTNPLPRLGRIEASNPCISGDSLISTEFGLMKMNNITQGTSVVCDNSIPIEIDHESGEKTLIYQSGRGTHLSTISNIMKTGTKPVWKIETESGYELEATSDHKIMTTRGWIHVKDLTTDNEILIQSGEGRFNTNQTLPFDVQNEFIGKNFRKYTYNFPSEWNKELGQFLGWLVGDGWITKDNAIGLTFGKNDKEILKHMKKFVNRICNSKTKEIERQRNTYHLIYGAKPFVNYVKSFGINTAKAGEKTVPESVFTAPKESIAGFLQGLFSADGTVMIDEKKGNYYIRLTTKSIKLAKQVQLLLLNFGIKSKIYNRSRAPRKQFSCEKTSEQPLVTDRWHHYNPKSSTRCIPQVIDKWYTPYIIKSGEKKTYETDGILFEVHLHGKNIPRFNNQIGFLCNKHKEKIDQISNRNLREDVFSDRIKTIEYSGEKDVYDLTEPATHSFIANGFVISNCGEQNLHDGDVCNLGSINLDKFVKDGKIDWNRLKSVTRTAIRMLDNVIDLTDFPVEKVNKIFRGNRRIGLGVMGFADMLIQLGIGYDTEDGCRTAESVMKFIQDSSHEMSRELAEEKGIFPNWKKSVYADNDIKMRNAAVTCIAPTGTISMICDVSSGIEPHFALAFSKSQIIGCKSMHYMNRYLLNALQEKGLYSDELMEKIIKIGSVQSLDLPDDVKRIFVTSLDIRPEGHIKMQAAFQKHVDNSISKTCNFPYEATKEDVRKAYVLGWQLGCKSLTVYRSGSRNVEVLHLIKKDVDKKQTPTQTPMSVAISGKSVKTLTNCPECTTALQPKDGCTACPSCGWGACQL